MAGADGRAHRTPITAGIRDGGEVQVTSGLKAGDLVITSGGYALADGLRVTVAHPGDLTPNPFPKGKGSEGEGTMS